MDLHGGRKKHPTISRKHPRNQPECRRLEARGSPRLMKRGSIEARPPCGRCAHRHRSPRLMKRGSIEASLSDSIVGRVAMSPRLMKRGSIEARRGGCAVILVA